MNKREIDAIAQILSDPANAELTAEEVAERARDALDDIRSRTRRIAVVGQIRHEPQEEPQTVVLGPFSARGILDSEEKFLRAVQGGTAAREAGQHLAWDTRTHRGKGRFMLVPAFLRASDAWEFYRGNATAEAVAEVVDLLPKELLPVCCCGLRTQPVCRFCGAQMKRSCPRHEPEAEPHRCRQPRAAAA